MARPAAGGGRHRTDGLVTMDEDVVVAQLKMTGWLPCNIILTPTANGYRMTMPGEEDGPQD